MSAGIDPETGEERSAYQRAREAVRKTGRLESGLEILEGEKGPSRDLFLHRKTILESLSTYAKGQYLPTAGPVLAARELDSFGPLPHWDRQTTLIIHGKAGVGKTELAKALIPTALFISHLDRLKDFHQGTHGGIILDDMDFTSLSRAEQIKLADFDNPRDIHIRYKVAHIPAKTLKIVTTNLHPYGGVFISDDAIKRRCTVWEMFSLQDIQLYFRNVQ